MWISNATCYFLTRVDEVLCFFWLKRGPNCKKNYKFDISRYNLQDQDGQKGSKSYTFPTRERNLNAGKQNTNAATMERKYKSCYYLVGKRSKLLKIDLEFLCGMFQIRYQKADFLCFLRKAVDMKTLSRIHT